MTAQTNSLSITEPKGTSSRPSYGDRAIIVLALICTFIAFSPFGYAILTSFKSEWKDGSIIPFVQFEPDMLNWQQEFGSGGAETVKALRNSTLISLGATVVATTLGTLAGYGLARFKYGIGNRNLVSWFLSQRFLPPVATLIPFVLMFRDLKLLDTLAGMVIVNATFTLPFAVLIMRDYFADLPNELREAALVDGASEFTTFIPHSTTTGQARLGCLNADLLRLLLERVSLRQRARQPRLETVSDAGGRLRHCARHRLRLCHDAHAHRRHSAGDTVADGAALHRPRLDLRRGKGLGRPRDIPY